MIAKEQQSVRRAEFLRVTENQIDYNLMGPDGRRYLLKDTARALELDADKAVPDLPAVSPQGGLVPAQLNPAPPAPGNGEPPAPPMQPASPPRPVAAPRPRTLGPGGEPVAGQDFNLRGRGAIPNA